MGISEHYQFRAKPDLESEIRNVWVAGMNKNDNLTRIIRAGCASLKYLKKEATKNG